MSKNEGSHGSTSANSNDTRKIQKEKGDKKTLVQRLKAFFKHREYIPGDTYRYIFQKKLEIHRTYVYYRLAITVAHGASLVVSMFNLFSSSCPPFVRFQCIDRSGGVHIAWPFYLTSWGVLLNFIQSLMGLGLTVRALLDQRSCKLRNTVPAYLTARDEDKFATITGLFWGLSTACTILAFIIDLTYWILIYDFSRRVSVVLINNCAEHLFNLVWMIVDRCLVAFPVMLTHGAFLIPIGGFYIIASLTYFAFGGLDQFDEKDYLYEFLNWHYPGKAVLSIVLLTILAVLLVVPLEFVDRCKHKKFRPKQIHAAYEEMNAHKSETGSKQTA